MKVKGMKQAGFSLVELMVVVGIIGILAALAVPRFQRFTAKAKQSEAKAQLANINTLQQAYYSEQSQFGTFAQIGFVQSANSRYAYDLMTAPVAPAFDTYTARAQFGTGGNTRICPASTTRDTWTVNQAGTITNTGDGLTGC